jgi:hypothetical protein
VKKYETESALKREITPVWRVGLEKLELTCELGIGFAMKRRQRRRRTRRRGIGVSGNELKNVGSLNAMNK